MNKIIMLDFTEDVVVSSTVLKLLVQHGYTQHLQTPSTERCTLIAHVYIKDTDHTIAEVVQT